MGIDKKLKEQEAYLLQLQEEQQKYTDMINTYNYNKEVATEGTVEAKYQQMPDIDFTDVYTEIDMSYSKKYGMYVRPIVMIHNSGEYDLQIIGIETKYSVLNGENDSVYYPFSKLGTLHEPSDLPEINKFEGWIYKLVNGKILLYDVENYYGNPNGIITIAPGGTAVFSMPTGYCNILAPDGTGDVNGPYSEFLIKSGGRVICGESTDVTLFWKSNNPDNPEGRFIFADVRGDVYELLAKLKNNE